MLLVHGFIEHGGRYAPTAEALARRGYAVSVTDLRGHGKSDGPRCWIRSFDEYLDDLDGSSTASSRRAAGKPVFVLGHSLGGLIAVLWCIRRQPKLSGLILSGPALQVRQQLFPWLRHLAGLGSILFPRLRLVPHGGRNISATRRSSRVPRRSAGLSRPFSRTDRSGNPACRRPGPGRVRKVRVPLLILHGTADRVAAVEASQELFQRAEATDKTLRLYPGLYHEVLNEPEKEQVLADLIEWIEQRVT